MTRIFIWDFVASTVLNDILDWFYGQIVGFLGAFFGEMGSMGVELFEMEWVQAIVQFFSQLAWALFGVSLVVSCFDCGIHYASGRGNIREPAINALKGLLAVSLFSTVPIRLYALSVSLQGSFIAGLTGRGASIGDVASEIIDKFNSAGGLQDLLAEDLFGIRAFSSPFMVIFCLLLMAYAVIKVFFGNLKRGGILLIQIAVGSLYMFSVPRGFTDGLVQWTKQVIGLCLTSFLQSIILVAGLMAFNENALLGLGLMLSAGEVPKIAGMFGVDTSTRASLTTAVHTAQVAVSAGKMISQVIH